jgi:sRNA-binding regulator protein Hfq
MTPHFTEASLPDLVALARNRFGDLSLAETALLQAAPTTGFALCSPNGNWEDPTNDPTNSDQWGEERTIRASIIRWLCADSTASRLVDPKGIQVFGALIPGLDLSRLTIPFALTFAKCRLLHTTQLLGMNAAELDLTGTWVDSLLADGVKLTGNLFLRGGFRTGAEARLVSASVGTAFDCTNSQFTNPSGVALNADGIHVGGSTFLSRGFSAQGEIRLSNAVINGTLECDNGVFVNPSKVALNADAITVTGRVFFRHGFRTEGEVNLLNARIGSNLECDGAVFANPSMIALRAEGISVGGSVYLRGGFRADGEVNFHSAEIGSNLDCEGGTFKNLPRRETPASGKALNADRIKVKGYVFFRHGFKAEGEIKLLNAEIGSSLECDKGTFENPWQQGLPNSGTAINAERVKVSGYVFLRNGFSANGAVNFSNSQIAADLNCCGGAFRNDTPGTPDRPTIALAADGSNIHGSVFLSEGFSAEGEAWIIGAQVGGQISCDRAKFNGGLVAQATTAESFFWTHLVDPGKARLDLINARVYAIADDAASWPPHNKLRIDGFVYQRLSGLRTPRSTKERLDWLSRQRDFATQPYTQLANVFRANGDYSGARKILFEMERLRGRQADANWIPRVWSRILQFTIGFGFYPGRSVIWLLALTLVCALLYRHGYATGNFVPTDKDAYGFFILSRQVPSHYERFNPFIYAFENSFPLVKLGQTDRWGPEPRQEWGCRNRTHRLAPSCWGVSPSFLRAARSAQILLGWFFATMFVAAVTGVVRRE